MKKITTFKQIKEIIEPIDADQFCTGEFENDKGQCCLFGHIQKHISGNAFQDRDGFGARQLTRDFLKERHGLRFISGANVNNTNKIMGYKELVIKDRLMHMIEDGIKWEERKKIKWYQFGRT